MVMKVIPAAIAVLAVALAVPALAQSATGDPAPASDCVWGQRGYRACVDRLLATQRTLDPAKALRDTEQRTRGGAQTRATGRAGRRPGAGSLTPTPPAELRITPPTYDPAQEAIASDRRQRALDDNLNRIQRDTATPPIMPPVLNPPNGRICPAWGC